MYKEKYGNVEIYFICYKKEEMKVFEYFLDPVLKTNNWYFNCYLAYQAWQSNFQNISSSFIITLLTLASGYYLNYMLEKNKGDKSKSSTSKYLGDLKQIDTFINQLFLKKTKLKT